MRTGVENGVGTAYGIRAGPLTSRGLGNAKLRGEGAMTDPLLEDLDGALPNLGRMRTSGDVGAVLLPVAGLTATS